MKNPAAMLLLLLPASALADKSITHRNEIKANGARIHKYELRQASDRDTAAVIRITHSVQGEVLEDIEYYFYTPGDQVIGNLLISEDRGNPEIESPVGRITLAHDKEYTELNTGPKKLKGEHGAPFFADSFQMHSKNEIIEICLYQVPMKSARKRVPNLPEIGDVDGFRNFENQLVARAALFVRVRPNGTEIINLIRTKPE